MSNRTSMTVKWWMDDKEEAYKGVFDLVSRLQREQTGRMDKNIRSLQLYGSPDMMGAMPYTYTRVGTPSLPENRVKINIIASMCDTATSIIGKMRPKVTFLTNRGDAGLQMQAKNLSKFVEGAFYQNGVYQKHKEGFRDSTVQDLGALKHFIQDGKIVTERVLATELYFDPADCLYGTPSHMYQLRIIHRDVLCEMFPEHTAAIKASGEITNSDGVAHPELSDFVTVVEGWHLPIGKDKKFGRHILCVEQTALVDEEYKKTYFPFTWFRWSTPAIGFVGQSLAERLTGNQIEINKMLRIIQKSFHLGAAFKVFLEYGSKVVKEHINNDIGSIVYYNGTPPQFYTPKTVHEEYFRHLEWLITNSYNETGISQLTAQSAKPAGLDSGKALREYNDIQTERFASVSQDYEATYLETARQYIDLAKDLHEEGIDLEVKGISKKFIESIKWSDVSLEEEAYVMQMFPTSKLPSEPAGRLAFVQELAAAGAIEPEWITELLDFPDLGNYMSLKNAALEDIMHVIDNALNHGEYSPPEPYQNLGLGVSTIQAAYLRGKNEGVSDKRLELLRRWIVQAKALQAKAVQEAQMGNPNAAMEQGIPQAQQIGAGEAAQEPMPPAPIPGV